MIVTLFRLLYYSKSFANVLGLLVSALEGVQSLLNTRYTYTFVR